MDSGKLEGCKCFGYRDMEFDETNNKDKLIFLGHFFDCRIGVEFDESYYYKVRKCFGENMNLLM